ncbi:MAG: class I SAM-dependent methyltransferase [Bacteroidia bacterium]|nr:class I SAM-dependent methyltransferase [Bacteroidia bacterium]
MNTQQSRDHWQNVYKTKGPEQVSWTQEIPQTSLRFMEELHIGPDASVIDVGGGDSKLADHLLKLGFENITVLDISEAAIQRAQQRLGKDADKVRWIVSDVCDFEPEGSYDVWHDRAAFHFLTEAAQLEKYRHIAREAVRGYMIMGTFSEDGPTKCSGLDIRQYNADTLRAALTADFEKIRCITEDHETPFGTTQNFLFCSFRKIPAA